MPANIVSADLLAGIFILGKALARSGRASASHAEGRGFEPLTAHEYPPHSAPIRDRLNNASLLLNGRGGAFLFQPPLALVRVGGGSFLFSRHAPEPIGRNRRQQRAWYELAPERKGVNGSRESLERESGLMCGGLGKRRTKLTGAQNGLTAGRDPHQFGSCYKLTKTHAIQTAQIAVLRARMYSLVVSGREPNYSLTFAHHRGRGAFLLGGEV